MTQFHRTLIQFAKTPVAGQVKTRLIPRFGAHRARLLHEHLVARTLNSLARLPDVRRTLYVAGEVNAYWRRLQARFGVELHRQAAGHLGQKMHMALSRELLHAQAAVLVGSDCPVLDTDYLRQAFQWLERGRDLVLGPAEDGGYVLVGMRRPCAAVFEQVDWGTPQVLAQTLANAEREGLTVELLETRWDVDLPPDVERLATLDARVRRLLSAAPDALPPAAGS